MDRALKGAAEASSGNDRDPGEVHRVDGLDRIGTGLAPVAAITPAPGAPGRKEQVEKTHLGDK
jgi:hypothetical protein